MTTTEKQIRLMLFVANEQISNELIDDLQNHNELVRELKQELRRRETFRKKYITNILKDMLDLQPEDFSGLFKGLEDMAKVMTDEAVEGIEEEFKKIN